MPPPTPQDVERMKDQMKFDKSFEALMLRHCEGRKKPKTAAEVHQYIKQQIDPILRGELGD